MTMRSKPIVGAAPEISVGSAGIVDESIVNADISPAAAIAVAKLAVDIATQAELDTHTAATTAAHGGIVASNDSRLTDARAPTVHAASHKGGGSDVIADVVASGAAGLMPGTDKAKLDAVEAGATADMTAAEILTAVKTVDGSGSGLDADLLDGQSSAAFEAAGTAASAVATHEADTTNVHGITNTATLVLTSDSRLSDARTPTGAAGGVLAGTYPNPSFAADMATQVELDAEATSRATADALLIPLAQRAAINGVATLDSGGLVPTAQLPPSGVTSVSGTAPIASSGGATPAISITAATTSAAGSLSAADKTIINGISTTYLPLAGGTLTGRLNATTLSANSAGSLGTVEKFRINAPTTVDNAAATILGANGTAEKALVVQANASASVNPFEVQKSDGTSLFSVSQVGALTVPSTGAISIAATAPAISIGATPSTVGAIRMSNGSGIYFRDSGNTANCIGILLNSATMIIDSPSGGGSLSLRNSGSAKLTLSINGVAVSDHMTFDDTINVAFNTATGTKIGTGTTQKFGFWNATPVAQQTGDIGTMLTTTGLMAAVTSLTIGTTPATAGTLRIPNTGTVQARNAANGANLQLLSLTSGNIVQLGESGVVGVTAPGPYLALSATPATTGLIRMPNDTGIYWRNPGNTGDTGSIVYDSNSQLSLDSAAALQLKCGGNTAVTVGNSTATIFGFGITCNGGNLTIQGGNNIVLSATTGTKIGTGTTQKIGLWNATPVAQYATTGTTTGFTAGAGTAVDSAATFTGNTGATAYTNGDVVRALKLCGILAA